MKFPAPITIIRWVMCFCLCYLMLDLTFSCSRQLHKMDAADEQRHSRFL